MSCTGGFHRQAEQEQALRPRSAVGRKAGSGCFRDITNVAARNSLQGFGKAAKPASGKGKSGEREAERFQGADGIGPGPYGAATTSLEKQAPQAQAPLAAPWDQIATPSQAPPAVRHFVGDASDPQTVAEYAGDVINLLFHEEANFLPRTNYMQSQAEINGKMRAILIDWLVEVHLKYRLRPETLFLAVNLLDRYLSERSVMRKRLQLVGVVALFIAAKYEEISPPQLKDFLYMTDNAYTPEEMLVQECTMLTALSFKVVVPIGTQFLDFLQKVNQCDEAHGCLSQYILELALLDMRMIRYAPSHLASAALLLSNELFRREELWPSIMAQHSRHAEHALQECVDELRILLDAAPTNSLRAICRKFSRPQHSRIAKMTFC